MKKLASTFLIASLLLASSTAASAAVESGKDVTIKLTAQKVVRQADGTESLGKPDAGPGDIVEYKAVYTNETKGAVRQLLATLPIPAPNMEYLPNSSYPPNPEASVDGKTYAPVPLKREVVAADGSRRSELVPVADYRFLRWQIGELPAGKSITVSSRMKLINDIAPTRQAGKP